MSEPPSPAAAAHLPVLADPVAEYLLANGPAVIVDATLGLGGHAERLLRDRPELRIIGLDVDHANLESARERLDPVAERVTTRQANFAELRTLLDDLGVDAVDGILADLGFSTNQMADSSRGLSFELDGPLDMRLDRRLGQTAADLVNGLSEGQLADLLYLQSQERHSRKISRRICQVRRQGRINSTLQLARLVASAVAGRSAASRFRIHPATRTFMALRMAVNHEIESLAALLEQAPECLKSGGRVAIISFHSGEDRRVKEDFRDRALRRVYRPITKKPVTPTDEEARVNPRSRSAKLRVAERL
jgi:16S rRNA (cytosine1402-N4)-methyltransferase